MYHVKGQERKLFLHEIVSLKFKRALMNETCTKSIQLILKQNQ